MRSKIDEEDGAAEVPVVIRSAHLNNVRVIYREAKKHDRVLQLDKLSITPGRGGTAGAGRPGQSRCVSHDVEG